MSFEPSDTVINEASRPLCDNSQYAFPWSGDQASFEKSNLMTNMNHSNITNTGLTNGNSHFTSTEAQGGKVIDDFDMSESDGSQGKLPCTEVTSEYDSESCSNFPSILTPESLTSNSEQSGLRELSCELSMSVTLPDSTCQGSGPIDGISELDSSLGSWSPVTSSGDAFGSDVKRVPNSRLNSKDWKQNALRYPPCAVCTGKSSGLHYGCYTCEACKNFFRRYLLRSGGFNCKKNNNCTISNRSRGNCSGCRLKKCLAVGMSKEKSKIGRYTHSQRTETIREVNKLEGKMYIDEMEVKEESSPESQQSGYSTQTLSEDDESRLQVSDTSSTSDTETLTEAEKEIIDVLSEKLDAIDHFGERGRTPEGLKEIIDEHYQRYLAKVKLIGPLKAIPKDEYFTLLKLYNIDLDGRWNLFKKEANNCAHIVERYCKFAYTIPGFQSLPLKDQETLLKIGHCEFFVILMHDGYDHERQIFLEMNGVPSHIEEAADKIFSRYLIEMQADIFFRWQKSKLLKEEKVLLCAMSLLCSDRVDLENPNLVDKLHTDLTTLLLKLLRIHYGNKAEKRFAKFIDILTFCRQAADGYFKEYQEMSQCDMVQQVAPAFPTLCPESF